MRPLDRRLGPLFALAAGALVGTVAALVVAALETSFALPHASPLFVSGAERMRFVWTLTAMFAAAGAVGGVLVASIAVLSQGVVEILGGGPRAAGRVVATIALPLLAWTAILAVSGSGMRRIPGRLAIAAVAAFGATALVGLVVKWVAAWLENATRSRRAIAALGLVLAAVGLVIADRTVFPRLYGWLHAWLGAGAAGAIGAAILLVAPSVARGPRFVPAVGTFALLGALVLGSTGVRIVLMSENLRFVLVESSPGGARLLRLAKALGARPLAPRADRGPSARIVEDAAGPLPVLDVAETDVFLITIDALRADHLGAYGYGRPTSPRIDAFAKTAVVFDRAYTPTPHTSYAMTSLFTGKYVRSLVRLGVGLDDQETIADVLRARGFRTAAFYPRAVFFIDRERFGELERRHLGFEYVKVEPVAAEERTAEVLSYLDGARGGDRPRFVWAHYFEPHEPYRPAASAPSFGREAVDLYDSEIASVDRALGPLLDRIDRDHPDALVILTADHGEEFGDHGGRYHGTTVWEEQVRVPLLVRAPGIAPARVRDVVDLVDLFGTILALFDVPASPRLRSDDLRGLLAGGSDPDARAFVETDEALAAADRDAKLVCRTDAEACRLYDLARDPHERVGAAAAGPHAESLRRALSAWAASHARWEERPPEASGGPWPEPLRRAILGDATAASGVIPLLSSDSVEVRRRTAAVLGDLGAAQAKDALAAADADRDAEVRELAALSLARLGDSRALPRLEEGLRAEDARTKRRAALGLGALGDARAAPLLLDLLRDESWPLEDRRRAIDHLARLDDGSSVPGLVAALPILRTRPAVLDALGRIGDRRAVPALVEVLETDRYAHHRGAAVRALAALGDRRALPAILAAAASDDPPGDVVSAATALGGDVLDLVRTPPAGWRCDAVGCVPGLSALPVPEAAVRGASRVLVRLEAGFDGGRLSLVRGGAALGERPLARGWQEVHFDLPASPADAGPAAPLHLRVDPPDVPVHVRAALVVLRPNP